jgi:hypothetical protein
MYARPVSRVTNLYQRVTRTHLNFQIRLTPHVVMIMESTINKNGIRTLLVLTRIFTFQIPGIIFPAGEMEN